MHDVTLPLVDDDEAGRRDCKVCRSLVCRRDNAAKVSDCRTATAAANLGVENLDKHLVAAFVSQADLVARERSE